MSARIFPYDFSKGIGGSWKKYWVWWTDEGFNDDTNKQPVQLDLVDGEEFHIEIDSKLAFPHTIDTFNVRFHNVSCPNTDSVAIGRLETYIWKKDTQGNLTQPVRTVPTTGEMGVRLPPYWIALPPADSADNWGTFVVAVIDASEVIQLLLKSESRLTFKWVGLSGGTDGQKPTFRTKSLELYVICI